MAANTAIIGRVAVKVIPDTSEFRRDAQRELTRVETQLSPLTISTVIDMSGAARGALEELRKINARNRQTDSRKIRFATTISTDGMSESISKAVRQLNERAAQRKIKIDADLIAAVASLRLDPQSLKDVHDELSHFRKRNDPLQVRVIPQMGHLATTVISQRLSLLTRPRFVSIVPKLNTSGLLAAGTALAALSGVRAIASGFDNLWATLKNLDKAVLKIATTSTGLLGLAGAALTSASNIFALGSSLASLGGLLIPLPVLIGSALVSFIALSISFDGFGDAIKKGGDALDLLPPKMRAAADAVRSFRVEKTVLQETFWNGLAGAIDNVHKNAFPAFLAGLTVTTASLGGFFKTLLNAVANIKPATFANIFSGFNKSIDIAAKAMVPLVHVFATLGEVGASYLPRLAQWFLDIATRFDKFISAAAADGRLVQWVENAVNAVKALGLVFGNTFRIFRGLAGAASAAGGSSLSMLAQTLGGISDAVNTPAFQQGLTDVLAAAHAGFQLITTVSGPAVMDLMRSLSTLLKVLLPQVGFIIGNALSAVSSALAQPEVAQGIMALFDGVSAAVTALAPAMAPVARVIGALAGAIGTFATNVAPLFATVLMAVAGAALILLPSIEQLIPPLTMVLQQALVPMLPVLPVLAGMIGVLALALGSVLTWLGPLVPLLVSAFVAWKLWTTGLSFAKLIISLTETLYLQGLYIAEAVAGAASTAAAWVASAATTVASLVATAAGFVAQGAVMVATMAATVARVVAGWLLMAVQATLAAARSAIAWLISMGPIALIIAAVIGLVVVIVKNWSTIRDFITRAATAVLDFLRKHWPLILAILTGPISLAVLAIVKNWDKISAGAKAALKLVTDGFDAVVGFITGIPGRIGSAAAGMFDGIKDAFKSAINWIIDKWNGLQFKLPEIDSHVPGIGKVGGFTLGTPDIPRLAAGAFVPSRPGGILANLGEGSLDELVLPLPPGMQPKQLARLLGDLSQITSVGGGKTLQYYAAPNSSLSSEEELFRANDRARMVGW